ncbi:MAG TPA: hypothetical protein V6D06_03855 [Trichocoleus sp.]
MAQSQTRLSNRPSNVPIVAVACLVFFLAYFLVTTGSQRLRCQQHLTTPSHCEAVQTALFGLVPYNAGSFEVETLDVVSELTDRIPRGGVRFHHRIRLSGAQGQFTVDLNQSPLAGSAVKKQIQDFLEANGSGQLTFEHRPALALVRTGLMAFLLSIVAWGFWDVRWPRPPLAKPLPEEAYPE